ncbi:DUF4145 domain-containing protein [Bacillus paralicheniformis]|uniref:DUF4145 domain-containing protein n=1 Tax=Bacillus TaxID=1386 RepID=UPI001C211D57|nr:DUF4145 domain-containing protein [Bacillus paralicheniformis]MBU8580142.1 DUF4145 domain-containing protein [Bacillus paralicheniformis]
MFLDKFIKFSKLSEKTEIEKVKLLAFYKNSNDGTNSFSIDSILQDLSDIGHPISNISRLKKNIAKSRDFKKKNKDNTYVLTPSIRDRLQKEYGSYFENTDEITSSNEVLDEGLFLGKRGYLDKLIKQINNCYTNNCFDACAVLMRRVFEVSLILAYEHHQIQDDIKDANGDYLMLEKITKNALKNKTLNISRSRNEYNSIRELGNFAAHKIKYNTRKKDIDDIKQTYRVCLEELYYLAGLLK